MEKYKLIKEYPNSPKLGTEIIKSKITSITEKNTKKKVTYMIKGESKFKLKDPENYPEFWKLVVEKAKTPLFKTEDGVDIFENDIYYHITPDFTIFYGGKADTSVSDNLIGTKGYYYFSTREKAEKYILMNKPCFSIKEICPIIGQCNNTTYIDLDQLTEKLKKLVESKL